MLQKNLAVHAWTAISNYCWLTVAESHTYHPDPLWASGMQSLDINAAFGKILARLRNERGWAQEFLGFECNLTRNYISLLERGLRSPTLNTIVSLSAALSIRSDELIRMTLEELETSV